MQFELHWDRTDVHDEALHHIADAWHVVIDIKMG